MSRPFRVPHPACPERHAWDCCLSPPRPPHDLVSPPRQPLGRIRYNWMSVGNSRVRIPRPDACLGGVLASAGFGFGCFLLVSLLVAPGIVWGWMFSLGSICLLPGESFVHHLAWGGNLLGLEVGGLTEVVGGGMSWKLSSLGLVATLAFGGGGGIRFKRMNTRRIRRFGISFRLGGG